MTSSRSQIRINESGSPFILRNAGLRALRHTCAIEAKSGARFNADRFAVRAAESEFFNALCTGSQARMIKHFATVGGVGLAAAFVAVFFMGRTESKHLTEVAPRVGMSYDDLMAMGPRVASQTGVTLGTSRRVVYLLACSGLSTKSSIEVQATQASTLARQQRLSDREAVVAVLAQGGSKGAAFEEKLKGC